MLHLVEMDKQWAAAPCVECMEKGTKGKATRLCDSCKGYLMTMYTCPYCKATRHFFGVRTPAACGTCKRAFPNLSRIKVSLPTRIDYHLDKKGIYA